MWSLLLSSYSNHFKWKLVSVPPHWDNSDNDAVPKCAHRGSPTKWLLCIHYTSAVTPSLLLCPSWRCAYAGVQGVFSGAKTGHREQWGRGWHLELSPRCQLPERVMCQICRQRRRVGVQLGRSPAKLGLGQYRWGGVRECRHTSDESLYVGRGPQRTKRHKDRLFLPAKMEGHSGIWNSIHPATA